MFGESGTTAILGRVVAERRRQLCFSVEELAIQARISVAQIIQLEAGQYWPSWPVLTALCNSLCWTISDFFTFYGQAVRQPQTTTVEVTDDAARAPNV